jgi:hypothetical protein
MRDVSRTSVTCDLRVYYAVVGKEDVVAAEPEEGVRTKAPRKPVACGISRERVGATAAHQVLDTGLDIVARAVGSIAEVAVVRDVVEIDRDSGRARRVGGGICTGPAG